MNENILLSYQNLSCLSSSTDSSSSSSLKKAALVHSSKNVNENIANSITQLNTILNTQQIQNNANDFFYKNFYTRDSTEIQIVNDARISAKPNIISHVKKVVSPKDSNFIITPPPTISNHSSHNLTRTTSYLINEKIKQFNNSIVNSRAYNNTNIIVEDSLMLQSALTVSNGYEKSASNNSLSQSVLSNNSSLSSNSSHKITINKNNEKNKSELNLTNGMCTSSPSYEMDDEISFLKAEGVVKTLRKKFSLTNTPNNNNNNDDDKQMLSYRSDCNFNYISNVNNNKNNNKISNSYKKKEDFKFQKLKNLSTSSLDMSNEIKPKNGQFVKFKASIEPDEFLTEVKESGNIFRQNTFSHAFYVLTFY